MRVLIDVGHPGDFYLFKNFSRILEEKGNSVLFTVREGENETEHLKHAGLRYYRIGKKHSKIIGKISGIPIFTLKIIWICLRFRPTHFVSHGSLYAGLAAFVLRKPHIAMEDTGNMEQIRLSKHFSDVIISSDVLPCDFGKKHIRYKGYHELCYLLPRYFAPNKDIYQYLGLMEGTPYAIVRFVSWNASHDLGQKGFTNEEKLGLVKSLSSKMKVFVSAEKFLDKELEAYRINIPVYKMHDALAFASIYIGEGATMASEAGVLGTPSVYVSTIKISYTQDQEKYGTVYNFTAYSEALFKIEQLIAQKKIKLEFDYKRQKLLSDKIDVTAFMVWFVENYPESFKIMKENPDYQLRFKN
jgi:uncharacterized protein